MPVTLTLHRLLLGHTNLLTKILHNEEVTLPSRFPCPPARMVFPL